MAEIVNYQLSIFGTYSILPTPENVTSLMNVVNNVSGMQFLPNLISGQQVEFPANRITSITNLGYVTQDQKYGISFLNERIDVSYNRVDNADLSFENFYSFAEKILSAVMEKHELSSYRLAANIEALERDLSGQQIMGLGKSIISSAKYYKEKPLTEWSTRINAESDIEIDKVSEKLNTILNVSTVKAIPSNDIALMYHIDINTVPENTRLRFKSQSLGEFVDGINPIVGSILDGMKELTSIDE